MAVRIRLRKTGCRNDVSYRVVATDSRFPRDGRFLENLGWYDPQIKGVNFKLDLARIEHWKRRGALVSDTVRSLVKKASAATGTPAAAAPPAGADEPPGA